MKKCIPKLRFKNFNDEWEKEILNEIVQITMGQSPNSESYTENPSDHILVQGNADLQHKRVVPRVWTTQVTKTAEPNDIILSVRAPVGDVGKTDFPVVIGRGVAAIKANDFIYHLLDKMKSTGFWNRYSTGSTFESISSNDIKNAEIHLPSLPEQSAIGTLFQTLDELLSDYKDNLVNYQALKTTMLSKMFPKTGQTTPEIRLDGFDGEWEIVKLGTIGKTKSGVGFPDAEQGGKRGVPFYKVSDMNNDGNETKMVTANNYVTKTQISIRKWKVMEEVPAVIFAKVGAAIMLNRKRLVDKPYLIDNNMMSYIFDKSWDIQFGKTLFDTLNLSIFAQNGALPSFNGSDIEMIKVSIPSFPEQGAIGAFFANLDDLITSQQAKIAELETLKKKLLQDMFV